MKQIKMSPTWKATLERHVTFEHYELALKAISQWQHRVDHPLNGRLCKTNKSQLAYFTAIKEAYERGQ